MNTYEMLRAQVPQPGARVDLAWSLDVFPDLRLLATTPQDRSYHAEGNVWIHTQMVVNELVNGADYAASSDDERFVLYFAALLHDVAKPGTTVIDEVSGKIGQPGHSRRGAIDSRILLWRAGVPFNLREAVCRIITVHQLPFFAIAGNKNGQSPEFLIRKLSHELDLRLLSAVAEADMRGRHYEKKADCLVDIELFREMARDEDCYGKPRRFADLHTQLSYFRGAGISPDYPFHQEAGSKVVVLAGLPASGKNTWVAKCYPELPVISFDDARAELGLKHGTKSGAAVHLAVDNAKALLRESRPFVWNATHISGLLRRKTLDLLYAYNAEVELVYLEQPEAIIFQRNTRRDTTLTNAAIEEMLWRWEVPLPTEAHSVHYEVVS
jgi:predicted kinase